MYLTSIYSPSNILERGSVARWFKKNWWIAITIIAIHFLLIYLWIFKPDIKQTEVLDEVVIDLSLAPIIPKTPFEQRKQEYLEKKAMPDAVKPAPGLIAVPSLPPSVSSPVSPPSIPSPAQPKEVTQVMESTATVKLNEPPIKPIKVDKVEKAEPLEEKKIPIPLPEKVEEKKPPLMTQPLAKPQTQPQSLLDEAIPNMLPAIVDKKNKDKDAPEISPPAASASATAAVPGDSSKVGGSSAGAASASASSAASAPATTSASTGRPGPSIAAPSTAEMQGQIASPKADTLGSLGGNPGNAGSAGTADADYKSEGLKNAQPIYPLYARKMNQEGVVILSVEVLTDGSAGDVRVATSSGIRLLDKAALEAVKEWNFKPAKKDGVPYVQRLRIPIIFSLSSK